MKSQEGIALFEWMIAVSAVAIPACMDRYARSYQAAGVSSAALVLFGAGGVMLLELLMVVAIGAILATLAAPPLNEFINNTRRSAAITQLTSDLYRARSEAINRNTWMLVCQRNSAGTGCGTGTNWQNGWLVCQDSVPNGNCDAATADRPNPIAVHQELNPLFSLTGSAPAIRFNPRGTQGAGGAATLTLASGLHFSVISIAVTGHITKQ